MQCKDIPTEPILRFLAQHQGQWATWYANGGQMPSVRDAMPAVPDKLALAKMRQMLGNVAGRAVTDKPDPGKLTVGLRAADAGFVIAIVGFILIWLAVAAHFGWWLLPAGIGLGLLLAGLAVIARDTIASVVVAYFSTRPNAEGSADTAESKPHRIVAR